jgi:hypothetical protein
MKVTKRTKLLLSGTSTLILLVIANYLFTPIIFGRAELETYFRPRSSGRFNSEAWLAASPFTGERYVMVDNLLQTEILLGMDETKVRSLLGKPDLSYDQNGEKCFDYILGNQHDHPSSSIFFPKLFANLDKWWLGIKFRTGKVYSVRVFFT